MKLLSFFRQYVIERVQSKAFWPNVAYIQDWNTLFYEFRSVQLRTKRSCLNWILAACAKNPNCFFGVVLKAIEYGACLAVDQCLRFFTRLLLQTTAARRSAVYPPRRTARSTAGVQFVPEAKCTLRGTLCVM